MKVKIIGIPRFDFYFPPFYKDVENQKKTILICTNFVFSQFVKKDKSVADKLFAPWKDRISSYKDYWGLIKTNAKSKELFFAFLDKILKADKYKIILKPHPGEDRGDYDKWYGLLSKKYKANVKYDKDSYFWELIPKCDLEISCESCTTALESWVVGKKTIELEFTKHPVFYHEFISKMGPTCDNPDNILELIDKTLHTKTDKEHIKMRKEHLAAWCDSPDGNATLKLAKIIKEAVLNSSHPDFTNLSFSYKRKALKLKLLKNIDKPYGYDFMLGIKHRVKPSKYSNKVRVLEKNIKPSDVLYWTNKINKLMEGK